MTFAPRLRSILTGLGLAAALASPRSGLAADAPAPAIVSDRPSFVPSPSTVGELALQIETGVERLQDGKGVAGLRTWSTPTLVRLGFPNGYELRLESLAYSHVRTFGSVQTGMSDLEAGIKGEVPRIPDPRLSMAWIVAAGFPTGSTALRNDGVRPSVRVTAQWPLDAATRVTVSPGIRLDQDATGTRFPTGMLGAALTREWNPVFRSYAEIAAREIREANRGGKLMVCDVGAAWRVVPETQLDAAVGFGLKDNDPDLTWTIGVSRRFVMRDPGGFGSRGRR